jgi:hypothetical protein
MGVFGMSMNNGQKLIGAFGLCANKCDQTVDLPEGLAMITVYFTKDEQWLHSMIFYGATTVYVGCKRDDDIKRTTDNRRGRFASFELEEGEELLGCELHYEKRGTFGVTWIKWRPPCEDN